MVHNHLLLWFILWGSGILSGIIDNIPYTATMTPMIAEISATKGAEFAAQCGGAYH